MKNKIAGMIFAAGLGTRLRPFTLSHPKAMVEVGGKPMVHNVIERMTAAGIKKIVINVHHFASEIIDYVRQLDLPEVELLISDESNLLLDTGGGILHASPLLENVENLVVYNADVWCDLDLKSLIACHNSRNSDVTLAVSKRHSSRMLYFDNESLLLKGWQNISTGQLRPQGFSPEPTMISRAYSGIQIISPSILFLHLAKYRRSVGEVFSIIPFYLDNLNQLTISAFDLPDGTKWFDVGRPDTLEVARMAVANLE